MNKQYISILDLLPTLLGDEEKPREAHDGLFASNTYDKSQYNYEVEEANTPDKKKLHFKNLHDIIAQTTNEILNREGHPSGYFYKQLNNDIHTKKPYIMGYKYEVPHLLELEFLKQSPYGNILDAEQFAYVENIMYQYLLYYDRIVNFSEEDMRQDMHHYRNTGENSDLYINLEPFIIEKDTGDDDFEDFVKDSVMERYRKLSKIKRPTKKVLRRMPLRMYASRNLEELLEIAHTGVPRRGHGSEIQRFSRVEDMSNAIPLLMIYSIAAQETKEITMPSYRSYHETFQDYPRDSRGELRVDYPLEEYINDISAYNYIGDIREEKPAFYLNGSSLEKYNNYIINQDERMNTMLIPQIMNQIRIACFTTKDTMVVPQGIMSHFGAEPWGHLVEPETILNQRHLDWSED